MSLAQMLGLDLVAALFLDRDGVINVKAAPGQYITSPDDLILLPRAAAAIRHVNALGVPVYVVTNQRWVAHQPGGIDDLEAIHDRLRGLLGTADAHVDGIYSCVHEIGCCRCRKPERGLVDQVLSYNPRLAVSSCALVGDAESDVDLAQRCGMYSVRVSSGDSAHLVSTRAAETVLDLYAAVVDESARLRDALIGTGTTEAR